MSTVNYAKVARICERRSLPGTQDSKLAAAGSPAAQTRDTRQEIWAIHIAEAAADTHGISALYLAEAGSVRLVIAGINKG